MSTIQENFLSYSQMEFLMENKIKGEKQRTTRANIAYSSLHATYWMYYGVIYSFSSVFLLSNGYSNFEIGIIIAVGNILAVLLQPIVADFADRSKNLDLFDIMKIITAITLVSAVIISFLRGKSILLSVSFTLALSLNTMMQPFCNSVNFKLHTVNLNTNFGFDRSFGSLGYSVLCFILGFLVAKMGIRVLPVSGIIILIALFFVISLQKRQYEEAKELKNNKKEKDDKESELLNTEEIQGNGVYLAEADEETRGGIGPENQAQSSINDITLTQFFCRNKVFMVMSLGTLGVYIANAIMNSYMAQITSYAGGGTKDLGTLFSVLALLEIPTLMLFNKIQKRFRCTTLLIFAAWAFVLRMAVVHLATNIVVLFISQLVQPFSFALFLPAMVHFIDENMSEAEAIKGQAIFTTMTTVAGVITGIGGGLILDHLGVPALTIMGTFATLIGALVISFSVKRIQTEAKYE